MTDQRQRDLYDGISAALSEQAAQERYRRVQRRPSPIGRPRPLEFDESGFPLPPPTAKLVRRVARLLP